MSNILIIKHGSLGDIVQISGALKDIRETHKNKKIFILTTNAYVELLSKCNYLDGVIVDKRLPRWNLLYLYKLRKLLKKFNFIQVYDLQNSARTNFYRRYLLNIKSWCSTETTLEKGQKKKDLDSDSVLNRFKIQLDKFNIITNNTLNPDFRWAASNIDNIINKYFSKKFILLFPFCSPELQHKKWPYFNKLISIIKAKHNNFEIAIAPGPDELEEAKSINSVSIKKNNKPINIMELAGLILKSSYIIANDTGPAHMTAHLRKEGLALFGYHTSPQKVSIETEKFKTLAVDDLKELSPELVYLKVKEKLELIN